MYVFLTFCERCEQFANRFTSSFLQLTTSCPILGTNISSSVLFPKTAKFEARLRKNLFSGKAINITHSECVICKLNYPACDACAACYNVTYGLSGCIFFPTLSHKQHDFRKNLVSKMCVLIFSTNFFWNISRYKKKWSRYDQKCLLVFM
jgi:hypothetical protein